MDVAVRRIIDAYTKELSRKRNLLVLIGIPLALATLIFMLEKSTVLGIVSFIFIVGLIVYFSFKLQIDVKRKYIDKILVEDLNPKLFKDVIYTAKLHTILLFDEIYASYLLGDYQTVVNMCYLKLDDKACKNQSAYYLHFLARVYFDTSDFDKLREVCNKFDEFVLSKKHGEKIEQQYNVFKFYKFYLNEEYDSAKEFYERLLVDPMMAATKLSEIQMKYTYALTCYYVKEFEKANEMFSYVKHEAPMLVFATLADRYLSLEADGNPKQYVPESNEVLASEEKLIVKTKRNAKISMVIVAILVAYVIFTFVSFNKSGTAFEVIAANESISEIVEMVEVNDKKDVLCLYETTYDEIGVAYLEFVEEDKYRLGQTTSGWHNAFFYKMEVAKSDLEILFSISEEGDELPDEVHERVEFDMGEKTWFFTVHYVKSKNVLFDFGSGSANLEFMLD